MFAYVTSMLEYVVVNPVIVGAGLPMYFAAMKHSTSRVSVPSAYT